MLRGLQRPPGALLAPRWGPKHLWRRGRPGVANKHAEWGGVGPGREGRGTRRRVAGLEIEWCQRGERGRPGLG